MNDTTIARPRWMTAMAGLCALSAVFPVYRDLAIPAVRDVEVWLGFELRGRAALLTPPPHWGILAVGAWAYWTQRRWSALAIPFWPAPRPLVSPCQVLSAKARAHNTPTRTRMPA